MGGLVSMEEHPAINIWTDFLKEWEIDYEEETLLDLISWTKKRVMEPTKETGLDINNCTQTGKYIIDEA